MKIKRQWDLLSETFKDEKTAEEILNAGSVSDNLSSDRKRLIIASGSEKIRTTSGEFQ